MRRMPPPLPSGRPLTVGDVARALGVTTKTVTRYANEGRIPGVTRTLGGHRRFDRAEVTKLQAELGLITLPTPAGVDQ